jgi:hypothetical protein
MSKSAVTDVAKKQDSERITVLSTGIRARIRTVSASLLDEVVAAIPEPVPPTWTNPEDGETIENVNHPDYQRSLRECNRQRGMASIDALIMFGLELIDGVPADDEDDWLRRLRFLKVDLSGFDPEDPFDREFLYKKYIAVGSDDLALLSETARVSPRGIQRAVDSFPGDQEQDAD